MDSAAAREHHPHASAPIPTLVPAQASCAEAVSQRAIVAACAAAVALHAVTEASLAEEAVCVAAEADSLAEVAVCAAAEAAQQDAGK